MLQKEYGDSVVCLSLSFDYEGFGVPEDVLPPVRKFLEQVSAGSIENLLNRDGADSLYTKMNLTSVPVVMVWDRDGTLVQQFDDDYANKKCSDFESDGFRLEARQPSSPIWRVW